jgi:hypothetical protein
MDPSGWRVGNLGVRGAPLLRTLQVPTLPFKANADCRDHIPRQRRRVAN